MSQLSGVLKNTVWLLLAAAVIIAMKAELIPLYHHYSVMLVAVFGIVVLSVSLLAKWAGVWSVGHTSLLAFGAYIAANGSLHGWPLELVVLLSLLLGGAAGAFLGFAGARFSILYIALLTLIFNLVALEVINRWVGFTGGDEGIAVTELSSVTGFTFFAGSESVFTLAVVVFALTLTVAGVLRGSALRMRMQAAKSHPSAARVTGISPTAQTALAFAVSGAFTGLAGVLLGLGNGFVSPEVASLHLSTNVVAATVLGGVGSLWGALIGGLYLTIAPSLAEAVGVPQLAVQGVLLVVVLIVLPQGLAAIIGRCVNAVLERVRPGDASSAAASVTGQGAMPGASPEALPERLNVGDAPVVLDARDVRVHFGGLNALSGVTLNARRGEVVGIIGPNGAGKSTLLNVISGLLPARNADGDLKFEGRPLPLGGATRRRRMGIGRTFQHAELFSELTIFENVMCGHRRQTDARRAYVRRVLSGLGLAESADSMPADLSFGVQKRVDLARALMGEPTLVLMDEPFGGLDQEERELIVRAIRWMTSQGITVVIIDHVLEELTAVADRVTAIDFGVHVMTGEPTEVLEDSRVRASYLGAESDVPREVRPLSGRPVSLRLSGVSHRYGGVQALEDLSLDVPRGSVLAVVGANGAGKSTVGKLLHGSLTPTAGKRVVEDRKTSVSLVPEGRGLFGTLTVRENLEVSGYVAGMTRAEVRQRMDFALSWLPEGLRERQEVKAALLSGGEQQMVAIARALMADPDVMVLDEPALGLSPTLTREVYDRITDLADDGMTVVLLEQSLGRALAHADLVYVLRDGRLVASGHRDETGFAQQAEEAYFGLPATTGSVER